MEVIAVSIAQLIAPLEIFNCKVMSIEKRAYIEQDI